MDRFALAHRFAKDLAGPVGDHFIGVHVGLGTRSGLPDNQREVIQKLALGHF